MKNKAFIIPQQLVYVKFLLNRNNLKTQFSNLLHRAVRLLDFLRYRSSSEEKALYGGISIGDMGQFHPEKNKYG